MMNHLDKYICPASGATFTQLHCSSNVTAIACYWKCRNYYTWVESDTADKEKSLRF